MAEEASEQAYQRASSSQPSISWFVPLKEDDDPNQRQASPYLYIQWSRKVKKNTYTKATFQKVFDSFAGFEGVICSADGKRVAVVIFQSAEEAQAAKEALDDKPCDVLHGRTLSMTFASRRTQAPTVADVTGVASVDSIPPVRIEEIVEGCVYIESWLSEEEERLLLSQLDDITSEEASNGWLDNVKGRRVQHYRCAFDYTKNAADRSLPVPSEPKLLSEIVNRLPQDCPQMSFCDQVTANEYLPGQGIAHHIDAHSQFEDGIAIISLAAGIVMDFKHPSGAKHSLWLKPRSLLVLSGPCRYEWTHGIVPRKCDVIDGIIMPRKRRVSITCRHLRINDCNCKYIEQCDSFSKRQAAGAEPESLKPTPMEQQYVHLFYEQAARHFSSTRYAPWPRVQHFLLSLPPGAVVADIGCGNGKYMKCVRPDCLVIGCDRSQNLVSICANETGRPTFRADALTIPLRSNAFDGVISIAVIHHLSTETHRRKAVIELQRILKPGGRGLIYAWAQEQKESSKRQFVQYKQDLLVPWHLQARFAGGLQSDMTTKAEEDVGASNESDAQVLQRYCHVFRQGELEGLVKATKGCRVIESYFDESNWCLLFEKEAAS